MGTGICRSEISECANQFSHSVCLVYLGTPKLVGKHLLSHKHRCILLDFWRRDIWTMRDQRSASTALLPGSWSNLWFWVKSNWAWPQHRPAQEYKLMDQRPLQEQTKPEQHPKWEKKKRDGRLGKAEVLAHFASWLPQNNTAVSSWIQCPASGKSTCEQTGHELL